MAVARPGDYITCKCGRCEDITGHVVMVVLGGEIAKVECKACGSVHKYRDGAAKKQPKAAAPGVKHVRAGQSREEARSIGPKTSRAVASAPSGLRKSAAAKTESAWQEAMMRHSGEAPVPYSMNAPLAARTLVEHPLFGKGEVLQVIRPDKAEILFQEGVKTLRCKL